MPGTSKSNPTALLVDASHDVAQGGHTRRVNDADLREVQYHRVFTNGCRQQVAYFTSGGGIELALQVKDRRVLVRLGHNAA